MRLSTVNDTRFHNDSLGGVVQIKHDGIWMYVCNDGWHTSQANIVCQQLYGIDALHVLSYDDFERASSDKGYLSVSCLRAGQESCIDNCSIRTEVSCTSGKVAGVICQGKDTFIRNSLHRTALMNEINAITVKLIY